MFVLKRNGKKMKGMFATYEEARSAARKWIRKNITNTEYVNKDVGYWDSINRNPSNITAVGFKITAVE